MPFGKYILDAEGQPVPCEDPIAWARWYEAHDDQRRVAVDRIGDIKVSTVFLGLDHNYGRGAPILYETMIFGGAHDGYQDRYHTRDQAVAGHAHAIAVVKGEAQP